MVTVFYKSVSPISFHDKSSSKHTLKIDKSSTQDLSIVYPTYLRKASGFQKKVKYVFNKFKGEEGSLLAVVYSITANSTFNFCCKEFLSDETIS